MKQISIIGFILICLSIFCFSVFAQNVDIVQLRYDFRPGEKQSYTLTIDGEVTVQVSSVGGLPLPANNAQMKGEFNYTHEVVGVNKKDKSALINVVYGKSYMNTIVNNKVIPNPDIPLLDGKVASVTVSDNGEVKKFKLPEDLPVSLQNADFRKMFAVFPARGLRIGESWIDNNDSVDDKNEAYKTTNTSSTKYTLLSVEKKQDIECAKVKFESVSNSKTESKNPQVKLDGNIAGKVEGIIYYNLSNGFVVDSDLRTKIENRVVSGAKSSDNKENPGEVTTVVNTDMHVITKAL